MALTGKRSRDKRGLDSFVPVSWEEAIDVVAFELSRIKKILKIKHSLLALMVGVLLEDFIMPKVNFIDFLIAMADILGQ